VFAVSSRRLASHAGPTASMIGERTYHARIPWRLAHSTRWAPKMPTESYARKAMRWESWSPDPWRWVGQAQLARNDLPAAQVSFRKAIAKDKGDWVLWYELARASKGHAARTALAQATRLNPKGPETVQLRAELRKKGRLRGP